MLKGIIKRKEDLEAFVSYIDEYLRCIYSNISFNYSVWSKYPWNKEFSKLLENAQSNEDKLNILKSLKSDAQKMETVLISSELGCSDALVNDVVLMLQENSINNIVIQCETDPKVVGGAHIFLKGRFIDATIRNRVVNLLSQSDVLSKYI